MAEGSRIRNAFRVWRWPVLAWLLALVAVLFSVLVGILIEQLLLGCLESGRVALLVVLSLVAALVLLAALSLVKGQLEKSSGTFYYVRMLVPWMSDWRQLDAATTSVGMKDVRLLLRTLVARAEGMGLDAADEVAELGAALEMEMNRDSIDTGYHVAANLLFPMAMALGYEMQGRPRLELYELGSREDEPRPWPLDRTSDQIALAPDEIKAQCLERQGFHPICWRRMSQDTGDGPVLLTVNLTHEPMLNPVQWTCGVHYAVGMFVEERPSPVSIGLLPQANFEDRRAHPVDAMQVVRQAIRDVIHDHPGRLVLLNARMPKSIAVGVGWLLGNDATTVKKKDSTFETVPGCGRRGCRQPGCLRLWTALVPIMVNQESRSGDYLAVRAHPTQPPIQQILDELPKSQPSS